MTLDAPAVPHGFGPEAVAALLELVPSDRVLLRSIDRVAFASDASFYRLVPQAIALARSIEEVRRLFRFSQQHKVALTFRAAGTSLSGQSITDGLLVEVARHWKQLTVEDEGRRVRLQPGVIGGHANRVLAAHGTRLGPDPASINACTIGGILANNSSGMCCGVRQNAYHTLESLTFVLPSGTCIDTAHPDADLEFRAREPRLAEGLLALKRRVEGRPALRDRIRAKYRTKNTTGYSLNAFLDFDRPVEIMRHLLIGSEGTLGFISEAVLRTVPDLPVRHTGLLLFGSLHAACAAIVPLRDAGAVALELMDRAAMRSVEHQPGVPDIVRTAPGRAAGLLVEFQAAVEADRPALASAARDAASRLALIAPSLFTDDPSAQARLWTMRKGMFPSVGAARRSGTTVIIEDVAFPIEQLANAALDLTTLFFRHGYDDAIVFGHAKDGNLHFVLSQSFNSQAAVDQYARFMDDVVRLVVERYDGALKAEHGTGRNMAPFVETEWGPEALAIMAELKSLVDPHGLLNPGVILNPDPRAHLADLKPLPSVEPEVDKCIECGYCESLCPSRALTLTPRQRIVVRRELARLEASGEHPGLRDEIDATFPYDVLDTCAADGLCATACPVAIDTGQLVKRFRALGNSVGECSLAVWAAEHFDLVEAAARWALGAGRAADAALGTTVTARAVAAFGALTGRRLPVWTGDAPRPAQPWRRLADCEGRASSRDTASAVYFPTCITRVMGALDDEPGPAIAEALVRVAARAGRPLWIPDDARGACCGVPFSSKGFEDAHAVAANRVVERFWQWSDGGRLPIVLDTSPCTLGVRTCRDALSPANRRRFDRLAVVDAVEFVHDELMPRLHVVPRAGTTVVHPVCSVTRMELAGKLEAIAATCSGRAAVPRTAGCCGFAGDRGFLVPELTRAALQDEAAEVRSIGANRHVASSRTCEVGLTRATGRVFRSFVHLVDEATSTRPA